MNKNPDKKLGVITSVNGSISEVGMYNLTNDSEIIWYGEMLSGPKVGAFLTIKQNNIKIIASVSEEKTTDQKNSIKSAEFDNRFSKGSINKVVSLQTKGVIHSNKFEVTSKYVPMIGNEVTLTTKEDLSLIYGLENDEASIKIGKTVLENQPIELSINKFFASHIGIFGNTGSGKSNTLHKLYLELFKTEYYNKIRESSQFIVIDFNGEYSYETDKEIFGVKKEDKKVFFIDTRNIEKGDKIPIKKEYLFDAEILSLLFDARSATQVPFLRKAMNNFNLHRQDRNFRYGNYSVGLLKKILTSGTSVNQDSLKEWLEIANKYLSNSSLLKNLETLTFNSNSGSYVVKDKKEYINVAGGDFIEEKHINFLKLNEITDGLNDIFHGESLSSLTQLLMYLELEKVYRTSWGSINREHLNPLFNRIISSFNSLEKIVEVEDKVNDKYGMLNIISLVKANREIKRLIPMILSKMFYDEHRISITGHNVNKTKHLIIDEAHNILNSVPVSIGDSWQDYRLSIFEEIIKEGRKFGFYLTLSSQRPSDISSTILSQVHNYFIHRLVNEKDLRMLENTMPTLDKYSYDKIPSLGKGETIITGNAIEVPVIVKVNKELEIRPNSDDIKLTELWK